MKDLKYVVLGTGLGLVVTGLVTNDARILAAACLLYLVTSLAWGYLT